MLAVLSNEEAATQVYDNSLVLGDMMLACHALGLGSCWIHRCRLKFEDDEFKGLLVELGVKGDFEGIGHCALGCIGKPTSAKPRRDGRAFWASKTGRSRLPRKLRLPHKAE